MEILFRPYVLIAFPTFLDIISLYLVCLVEQFNRLLHCYYMTLRSGSPCGLLTQVLVNGLTLRISTSECDI